VPRDGAFPLSFTLDSVGPLANTVGCCAAYDAVLSGDSSGSPLSELPLKGLRFMLPRSSALQELDAEVQKAFGRAIQKLSKAGAHITELPVPAFDRQAEYFKGGGFAGAESYYIHRPYLDRLAEYDPRVSKRVTLGKDLTGPDYVELGFLRDDYKRTVEALAEPFDAILMPTSPCVAPTIEEVSRSDDDYFRWNARLLRNNGLINFLDGCAVSLPCHEQDAAPVGLMVCGIAGTDRRILAVAAAAEREVSPHVERTTGRN
jgi:aspartyl-tRNA(Asn)/glutamyl-tRNA(Gln) amidotransferase subunit A